MSGAIALTATLRRLGFSADCVYKTAGLGKQLKLASAAHTAQSIIFGQEMTKENRLILKDMQSGDQRSILYNQFLSDLTS